MGIKSDPGESVIAAHDFDENTEPVPMPVDESGVPLMVHALRYPEENGKPINLQSQVWDMRCRANGGAATEVSCSAMNTGRPTLVCFSR